jgi:hypothetical protein
MLAGKPDAGNPHVRFDEGEQRDWRKPPVALYSTVICLRPCPLRYHCGYIILSLTALSDD